MLAIVQDGVEGDGMANVSIGGYKVGDRIGAGEVINAERSG